MKSIKLLFLFVLAIHFYSALSDTQIVVDDVNAVKFQIKCDIELEGTICLNNKKQVLIAPAVQRDLFGHWSFDDEQCSDSSGNGNHAEKCTPPAASFSGKGNGARLEGKDYIKIQHSSNFSGSEYTLSFWAFFLQGPTQENVENDQRWCPIVQKGFDDNQIGTYQRDPAVFFDRKFRFLRYYVSTDRAQDFPEGEYVESNARVPYQRWTHITIVRKEKRMKLYVNGILDAVNGTRGSDAKNTKPLYIGSPPWRQNCVVPFIIDEVKMYSRALVDAEIEAEAGMALGGIEPSFLQLGCINCQLVEAAKACIEGYHLCTSIEMHTGGYQVARAMGWVDTKTFVWTHGALLTKDTISKNETESEVTKGLGLCCKDIE